MTQGEVIIVPTHVGVNRERTSKWQLKTESSPRTWG